LGLFLGVSILSFLEITELLLKLIHIRFQFKNKVGQDKILQIDINNISE